MEWVSTNVMMPQSGVVAILYSPQVQSFCGLFYQGKWMYSRYFTPVHQSNEITHWMSLPEPPKINTNPQQ